MSTQTPQEMHDALHEPAAQANTCPMCGEPDSVQVKYFGFRPAFVLGGLAGYGAMQYYLNGPASFEALLPILVVAAVLLFAFNAISQRIAQSRGNWYCTKCDQKIEGWTPAART